ncbi:Protein Dok-7, partial [Araneus ventricosus]
MSGRRRNCLHLQLYRDSKDRCKNGPTKASLSLEGFLGMETGFTLDKESNTMALICSEVVVVLAFDSRELLIQWQVKVRANLVEEHQFLVQIAYVPVKSKLACGPARLHLLDYMFCLTAGVPPKLLGIWPLRELRRFGVVDGKFCFEGGSRCGKGEGLHVLLTNQAKDLVQAFDMASRGRLPGKRKVSVRKNASGVDGNTHSSLTGGGSRPCSGATTGDNEKIETCSSESSTKPLLSSGSDGSDVGKGVRPCHFHYRWPSCIVPCGSATRGLLVTAKAVVSTTAEGTREPTKRTQLRRLETNPPDSPLTGPWTWASCPPLRTAPPLTSKRELAQETEPKPRLTTALRCARKAARAAEPAPAATRARAAAA